jgi:hypothetical protein
MAGGRGESSNSFPQSSIPFGNLFSTIATTLSNSPRINLAWPVLWLRVITIKGLRAPFLLWIALPIICLYVLVPYNRPLVRGDGIAYLAWIDTLVLDGDIDFPNQAEKFQSVNTYQLVWHEETQRYVTVFPFGVAFLQAPFYKIGDIFYKQGWWNQNPDYFRQMQGVPQAYSLWIMIGANIMAIGAVILAWRVGRQLTENWTAAIAAWVFLIGTPLIYYSTTSPLNSHNPGAFMCACFIYCLSRTTGGILPSENSQVNKRKFNWLLWIALGISAGLMILTRWQLFLIALPGWGLLAWYKQWKGFIVAGITAAITLLPLPIFWNYLFNDPFTVPYDSVEKQSFFRAPTHVWDVFETLILHSPVILLSLFGLIFLWRINRAWACFCASAIGLQILINGAALDWYAGDSFGMRRMTELYPIYVILACALLGKLRSIPTPNLTLFRWATTRIILLAMIPLAFLYINSFYVFSWSDNGRFSDSPQRMIQFYLNHPYREEFQEAAYKAHIGPESWAKPGP